MVKVIQAGTRAEEYELRAKYLKDDYQLSGDGPASREFRINKVLHLVPFSPEDRVLDISSGKGLLFEKIHHRVRECCGHDVAPAMVERVRKKFAGVSNVSFTCGPSSALPYPDTYFDRVLMSALRRLLRRITQDGPVRFVGSLFRFIRQKVRHLLNLEPVLIPSNRGIWFSDETFVAMCRENRLEAKGFPTEEITGTSTSRYDYLIKPL